MPTPVLFVHHRSQPSGAATSLAGLVRELDGRFEPHVYVPAGATAELFRAAGAIVHEGPVALFGHTWDNPYRGLRWLVLSRELRALVPHLRGLRRVLQEERFPIVHLNDSPLLPAAYVAHARGVRVVWHLRSALAADGRDLRSRIVTRLVDRWGDAAIAIDEDVAATFRTRLPVTVVHNSVDEAVADVDPDAARLRLELPAGKVLVGYAGPLRRVKGWPELVAAARLLVDDDLPVHFVVFGGGIRPAAYFETRQGRLFERLGLVANDELHLRQRVAELGLLGSFSFLPYTSQTAEIYSALDIVTFPNQGAGLGRPVLEAALAGKPVIASGSRAGGGVLVPGETGLLLSDPSPERLAESLRALVVDPDRRRRMGAAAAAYAKQHFGAASNARAVESVYDALLSRSSPSSSR